MDVVIDHPLSKIYQVIDDDGWVQWMELQQDRAINGNTVVMGESQGLVLSIQHYGGGWHTVGSTKAMHTDSSPSTFCTYSS